MRFQRVFRSRLWGLAACVLLGACAGVPTRYVPDHYGSLDSATSSCRQNPALCAQVAGEEVVVPQAAQGVAEAGISVAAFVMALESELRVRIEKALTECADDARSQVLIDQWGARSHRAGIATSLLREGT